MAKSNVCVIDNEPVMLDLLCEVVEQAGLTAHGFTRASHFFEQLSLIESAAILVLDLHMPEMDGIEVMRRLAEIADPPLLILVSGHDVGVLRAAEKLGRAQNLRILASLGKPVQLDQFRALLKPYTPSDNGDQKKTASAVQYRPALTELRTAIRNNQLTPHYQPQLEIATGSIIGVEALVRWQHPDAGLIYPDQFIPLAEQCGLVGELTYWMIHTVAAQLQQWQSAGIPLVASVNISAMDITSLTLPEQLGELLLNNKLDPTLLTLELTESAMMGELVTSLDILTRLRLKGIGLSIDDFGTGYSSLLQLHRVPFSELKIDRCFVGSMSTDAEAHAIVKTCILLGHELGMRVVAEGVETEAQLQELKRLGCDIAQGYLFSRPVPENELMAWVKSRL